MGRVVLVTGVGRSGTSAIAGVLSKLGVYMGSSFNKATIKNKSGTYEDSEFFAINRDVLSGKASYMAYEEFIEKRESEGHKVWGIKDPALVYSMCDLPLDWENVRLIICERNRTAVIRSIMRAYDKDESDANRFYQNSADAVSRNLAACARNVHYVHYDDLLESPRDVIDGIAEFVFRGMKSPSDGEIESAVSLIRPSIRNWDSNGMWISKNARKYGDWGRIGISTRIAKHPEYHFFLSWTKLLTGNVRNGDKVLMPRGHQPAHSAANAIMRDLLESEMDSLFLVDDDMVFDGDELERLRTNVENQHYDIVSGFTTRRTWPPKPIVLKLSENQPGEPMSLHGDHLDFTMDVPDNSVVEVDAVGLAFTLIRRHVIEELTGKYGPTYTYYCTYGDGRESEDVVFSRKVRNAGFKIAVDTSVKIGHIAQDIYGWEEYIKWYNSMSRPDVVEFQQDELVGIIESALPHLSGAEKERASNVLSYIGVNHDS